MPRPNKRTTQLRKQAVVARSYIHSSNPSEAASSTWASTLAPATPPLSPTPSTLDLNIIPEETDVNPPIEPAEDDSPSTHDQESINNNSPDSDDSDPGYGSDDTIYGMEGAELIESLELQMEEETAFLSPLSASGNIRQCTGWMHTEVGRMLKMLRSRWRSSARGNTAHIGGLQRLGGEGSTKPSL